MYPARAPTSQNSLAIKKTSRPSASVRRWRLMQRESLHAIYWLSAFNYRLSVRSRFLLLAPCSLLLSTAQSKADCSTGNLADHAACNTDTPSEQPAAPD